jgi:hypothetical protein
LHGCEYTKLGVYGQYGLFSRVIYYSFLFFLVINKKNDPYRPYPDHDAGYHFRAKIKSDNPPDIYSTKNMCKKVISQLGGFTMTNSAAIENTPILIEFSPRPGVEAVAIWGVLKLFWKNHLESQRTKDEGPDKQSGSTGIAG